ncbi:JAB domain-containing protein [Halomonas sp. HAL1]|uniref:JAB domain-containing protein n=2 Tax=Oceanospirillales TaxID=135619 RepID=UPI001930C35D|nr:JAB domain-containing protein [Halomonas sp. HAL1]WKV95100.1 JAB domain-containing protein [Halomonas sp. HAL1]
MMKHTNQLDMFAVSEAAKVYSFPGKGTVETAEQRKEREDAVISEALNIIEARFYGQLESEGAKITAPWIAVDYLTLKYAELPYEVFSVTWLNSQHQVIKHEELFRGTVDKAAVYPREVVRSAIETNASAVLLCHNHPSGSPQESDADRQITKKLQEALDVIDVKVIDHIIVAGTEHVSFAERGLI